MVDTLGDKLSMVKTEALVNTLAYRVDVQTLCYILAKVDDETLIYALTDRLPVVEKEKVGNTPAKVECKAVLDELSDREKKVKVHTLSELKGMEMLDTFNDKIAGNEVESLGDTQVEVNAKALD